MNSKDYIAIASVIATHKWWVSLDARLRLSQEFAIVLQADNPRFNRAKFIEACMDRSYINRS